ncbi:BrnT family toxin [Agrobacterium vitis]|uniref:BrnT family toxin n=1 Tax=Agrobacterium vitis TaxID=373 RepID=UPI0015731704|nr:BrnT family toxin [Agrobacterium vitis]NSZ17357.1 BrnT family toxin [Agrobacterium vitis]QZO05748.1 BrnT family toxin [Agrobacterium vitis]UJL88186.1 BrnT family toxin [Agrobacterium vitis]
MIPQNELLTEFDWDEAKRISNLRKHNIDFEDVVIALNEPRIEYPSNRGEEYRTLAICPESGRLIAVVYTMRGRVCRIISARAARANERREYYACYP